MSNLLFYLDHCFRAMFRVFIISLSLISVAMAVLTFDFDGNHEQGLKASLPSINVNKRQLSPASRLQHLLNVYRQTYRQLMPNMKKWGDY